MSYSKTYQELVEMIRKGLLYVPMCRAIVRRAGVRPLRGISGSPVSAILWQGVNYAPQDASSRAYQASNLDPGAYIYPPADAPPGLQHTLTNLSNVAYVRVVAYYETGTGGNRVAFIPIYSSSMSPTSLSHWIAPDGRLLSEWHAEVVVDELDWPPYGAVTDLDEENPSYTDLTGAWAPPPSLEDPTHVLLGCALLVRELATIEMFRVEIQAVKSPVSTTFTEYFT